MKKITLAFALMAGVSMLFCTPGTPKLGKASIDKVIAAMAPEEKVHLLIGTGMEGFSSGDSAVVGGDQESRSGRCRNHISGSSSGNPFCSAC